MRLESMVRGLLAALVSLTMVVGSVGCRSAEAVGDEPVTAGDRGEQVDLDDPDRLPQGAVLQVRLEDGIDPDTTSEGDPFNATVTDEVRASTGEVLVPAGAKVTGRVTAVRDSNSPDEIAVIKLAFEELSFDGQSYPLRAQIIDAEVETDRETKDVLIGAGAGAAVGAALGAIISGESEGAILGGVLGGATGTAISLGRGDVDAEMLPGSRMTLRTTREIVIREAA